jgi:hypothetical protein
MLNPSLHRSQHYRAYLTQAQLLFPHTKCYRCNLNNLSEDLLKPHQDHEFLVLGSAESGLRYPEECGNTHIENILTRTTGAASLIVGVQVYLFNL